MKREAVAATAGFGFGLIALGVHGSSGIEVTPPMPPYMAVWHMSEERAVPLGGVAAQCLLPYGAPIVLARQGIVHAGQASKPSECQEGVPLGISALAAQKEERLFRQLEARKQAIAEAVRQGTHEEPATVVSESVTIANPYPVTKIYANRSREHWFYGRKCGAYGVAIRAGVLASGEVVWRLQSPLDGPYRPDGCPPGTMFVQAETFVGIK